MKFGYFTFLSLAAMSLADHAHSISPESKVSDTRTKRSIMDDNVLYKCPLGSVRVHHRCIPCEELAKKLGRPMKVCFGRCVDVRQPCEDGRNGWEPIVPDAPYSAEAATHGAGLCALILPGLLLRFAGALV